MDYIKRIRENPSGYKGPHTQFIKAWDESEIDWNPQPNRGPLTTVPDTLRDNDGKDPIVPNRPLRYDPELVTFAVCSIEENTGIPVGSLRVCKSTYRNYHPVLAF
jgi:hypothetical protein